MTNDAIKRFKDGHHPEPPPKGTKIVSCMGGPLDGLKRRVGADVMMFDEHGTTYMRAQDSVDVWTPSGLSIGALKLRDKERDRSQ